MMIRSLIGVLVCTLGLAASAAAQTPEEDSLERKRVLLFEMTNMLAAQIGLPLRPADVVIADEMDKKRIGRRDYPFVLPAIDGQGNLQWTLLADEKFLMSSPDKQRARVSYLVCMIGYGFMNPPREPNHDYEKFQLTWCMYNLAGEISMVNYIFGDASSDPALKEFQGLSKEDIKLRLRGFRDEARKYRR